MCPDAGVNAALLGCTALEVLHLLQCTGPFTDALARAPVPPKGAGATRPLRCLRDLRIAGGASQLSHLGVMQLTDRCASIPTDFGSCGEAACGIHLALGFANVPRLCSTYLSKTVRGSKRVLRSRFSCIVSRNQFATTSPRELQLRGPQGHTIPWRVLCHQSPLMTAVR